MTTLLRIDASTRIKGSHSRRLADYYQTQWLKTHPQGKIILRDLALNPVPHLTHEMIEAFQAEGKSSSPATALSHVLIQELRAADHLLIGSPMYNFSLPSTLKAYFDHVVRSGLTFDIEGDQYTGCLEGKIATLITARGGVASSTEDDDFQINYLKKILTFIGIGPVETITLQGTSLQESKQNQYFSKAKKEVDRLFQTQKVPLWEGLFSEKDMQEIRDLQKNQARAIIKGDATAYSKLCADDIQLMIPGHDIISGRAQFLVAEKKLFETARFSKFIKTPEKIERSGNTVVEIGRQVVSMEKSTDKGGVFSARQKYMHIFRLTQQGWRYAALMSNPSE